MIFWQNSRLAAENLSGWQILDTGYWILDTRPAYAKATAGKQD
ncbi:MAG: hypothetical protein WC374_03325 [Phycisphaerae bacterium]